ncbi:MAG: electron transport complex subunit E [Acidobacteria bacterium]|jgi:electron transport complex protein RnfE|nr:electron transport complex subunit E [Acidobacteriota bacterium]
MNFFKELYRGLIKENPTLVLLLGMCPTLAVSNQAINGIGMGIAATFVLVCSNAVIAALKNVTPDKVRIPVFIVVIACFVTIVDLTMNAYTPDLHATLGIFIPLIVVNCIILGRAEAYASKNGIFASIIDGLVMGLGFTAGLTVLGIIREFMGNGSIFGYNLAPQNASTILIFILPPGAFIALGYLIATVNKVIKKKAS